MTQKKVIMYTFKTCPYCIKAKNLLNKEKIEFQEIEVSSEELKELANKTKMTTVPQIFVDDLFIGGCEDLYNLYKDKKKFKEIFQK